MVENPVAHGAQADGLEVPAPVSANGCCSPSRATSARTRRSRGLRRRAGRRDAPPPATSGWPPPAVPSRWRLHPGETGHMTKDAVVGQATTRRSRSTTDSPTATWTPRAGETRLRRSIAARRTRRPRREARLETRPARAAGTRASLPLTRPRRGRTRAGQMRPWPKLGPPARRLAEHVVHAKNSGGSKAGPR